MVSITLDTILKLSPFVIPVLWATILIIISNIEGLKRFSRNLLYLSTLLILVISLGLTSFLWSMAHEPVAIFGGAIRFDRFSLFSQAILLLTAIVTLLLFSDASERNAGREGEFMAMLLFSLAGMLLLPTSANFLIIFIGLELISIPLYVLAAFMKDEERSVEAGVKYFVLSAFSSAFFIYGVSLVYGSTGSIEITSIATHIRGAALLKEDPLLLAGISLIMVALAFKTSLVPFHFWAPDVYEGAPTTITAFMATGVKVSVFSLFVRLFATAFLPFKVQWETILWLLSAFSMTAGNILALIQTNIKRMLAYSSIAHAGYIAVGILSISPYGLMKNPYSGAILYYLLAYIFMNLGAFGVVISLTKEKAGFLDIYDYSGLASRRPQLSLAMTIFLISLAGIPPTGGFFAKFYIFAGAVREGYLNLVILAVINCLISVYFYLRIIVLMYMYKPHRELAIPESGRVIGITLLLSSVAILLLGVFPESPFFLLEWIRGAFFSMAG